LERILVIRGGALGDFLVTLPAFAALRRRWPEAHFEGLAYPRVLGLVTGAGRGYFHESRSLEPGSLAGFFTDGLILDPDWVDYFSEFDLVVSWLYDPSGVFARNLAGGAEGAGGFWRFRRAAFSPGASFCGG